jgi:hypothetical protein
MVDSKIPLIEDYVNNLIENLPESSKNLGKIDLVLDGGIFNGSYLVGALYFLKEMEKRNYVKIDRISGCSVGSIIGFLYYIDALDLMPKLYERVNLEFKNNFTLTTIKKLKRYLKKRIPDDICFKVNNKLFICYNDIKKREKIIKSNYKNQDEIIDTIIKSCFIPFVIDNNMLYKNKYIDGINAYIFEKVPSKKILYMDLLGYDKFTYTLNIKNEKTNFHRILSGLLDIHCFFIKGSNTSMCSYVNDWNIIYYLNNKIKYIFEKFIVYIIYFINYYKKYMSDDINENVFVKITSKILYDIFCIFLETYCF